MSRKSEPSPEDRDWKQYWRDLEEDPASRKQVRREKRGVRRQFHKQERKAIRQMIENEEFYDE